MPPPRRTIANPEIWYLLHPHADNMARGYNSWVPLADATRFSDSGKLMFQRNKPKVIGRWVRIDDYPRR